MTTSKELQENYQQILQQIDFYQKKYQSKYQQNTPVKLLAVSKNQPYNAIIDLHNMGQADFAENYLQEALAKIKAINNTNNSNKPHIVWHYIGQIQTNKIKAIAENFTWVHSIDNFKTAKKFYNCLSQQQQLNILIQVNLEQDQHKAGISPDKVIELATQIYNLNSTHPELKLKPKLRLRGLMCLLKQDTTDFDNQYNSFKKLADLLAVLNNLKNNVNLKLDTLSMGMSEDFPAAIAAGSTIIRIGTKLFGERQ